MASNAVSLKKETALYFISRCRVQFFSWRDSHPEQGHSVQRLEKVVVSVKRISNFLHSSLLYVVKRNRGCVANLIFLNIWKQWKVTFKWSFEHESCISQRCDKYNKPKDSCQNIRFIIWYMIKSMDTCLPAKFFE